MFQERARTLQGLSAGVDIFLLCVAFAAAFPLRVYHEHIPVLQMIPSVSWDNERAVPADYVVLLAVSSIVWIIGLRRAGLYRLRAGRSVASVAFALLKASLLTVLATAAAVFALKMGAVSRLFFGYYFLLALLLVSAKHICAVWLFRRLRTGGLGRRYALVIGAGRPASWFAQVLQDAADHGYDCVGLLLTKKLVSAETFSVPVVGTIDDLDKTLIEYPVDEVFIVGGAAEMIRLVPVAETLIKRGRIVSLVSTPAMAAEGVRGRVTEFAGVPVVSFGPMPKDEITLGIKRAIDVTFAGAALVALLPIMLLIAVAIRVSDPGPVIFSQERLGISGRRFRLYKFRSMRVDAERLLRADPKLYRRYIENDFKLPDDEDPRISRLGRFLRRTSLDELPQLWNVFRGDMSLVGPRPIVPGELEKYGAYSEVLLSVRPGLTGQWQVSGRSDVRYPERAFMDLDYVGNHSLSTDVSILARTLPAVLLRKGAF